MRQIVWLLTTLMLLLQAMDKTHFAGWVPFIPLIIYYGFWLILFATIGYSHIKLHELEMEKNGKENS